MAAIRFGFNAPRPLKDTPRYDVPAMLSRNSFNGVVSRPAELRAARAETGRRHVDLCPTACACRMSRAGCAAKRSGRLSRWLAGRGEARPASAAAEALPATAGSSTPSPARRLDPPSWPRRRQAAAAGRRRRSPPAAALARPVPAPDRRLALYLNGACAAGRLGLALRRPRSRLRRPRGPRRGPQRAAAPDARRRSASWSWPAA